MENAHLPLEQHHCTLFHPRFRLVRIGSSAFWWLLNGHTAEKGHLRVYAVLSLTCEKAFAEIAAKVEFEQCGEILRHGVFITLPLVFAYILAVLVHRNAAACGEGGFR